MKIVVTLLIACFAFVGFSQVNQVDSQGRKQGKWEKIYEGTRVYMYRGEFKDNKPVGKFVYYYKSSKVKAVINHNALRKGRSVAFYYHENGNTMSYGIYIDMKKDSVWANFTPSGRLSTTETYKDDKLHGVKKIYYTPDDPNDRSQLLSAEMTYKEGVLDGPYKEYFLSQKLKVKGQYVNNKQDGAWENFHANGKRSTLVRYNMGKKHGYAIGYDQSGKRLAEVMYYKGRRVEGKELEKILEECERLNINPYTMKPRSN